MKSTHRSAPKPILHGRHTQSRKGVKELLDQFYSHYATLGFGLDTLEQRTLMSGSVLLPLQHPGSHDTNDSAVVSLDKLDDGTGIFGPSQAGGIYSGAKLSLTTLSSQTSISSGGTGTVSFASGATPSGRVPYGADYRDGTEFMLGDVWVTVVLLESNGAVDAQTENWTSTEIGQVKTEIAEGLQWWEDTLTAKGSKHDLNFFVDFTFADTPVQTKYEPVKRPYSDQTLWIDDFLNQVGYNTTSSIFDDLDRWNHNQRQSHSTDWAYTIFVADSSVDTDGKLSDGYFAYAYLGGPFAVMTYDNGGWGISRMGQVIAHETGHSFYALDEYSGAGTYTERSGYYNTQNLNASDGNPNPSSRVASIMAEASLQGTAYTNHTSSPSSLQMLGWKDSDGDGIFDVLDVPLSLTGTGSYNSTTGKFQFSGSSAVQTLANQNPRSLKHNITTNTVDRLQYRLDGGAWTNGDTYYESFSTSVAQAVPIATGGQHTIEFRTIFEETGLISNVWSNTFTATAPTPGIDVTPTSGLQTSESGTSVSFSVVLKTQPTANVVISLLSSDTTEGLVSTNSLTFTALNWNQAQTVTVTGVNDTTYDGNIAYTVVTGPAVSTDAAYNGLNPSDVSVVNADNDVAPGFTVTPLTGLTTTEAGGTASFTVALKSVPTANVVINLASSDTTEGTISVSSLTFTPLNWNQAQKVTVTGVNDTTYDGNIAYTIVTGLAVSTDAAYNGLNPSDVSVINTDNEVAPGVTVTALTSLTTTESKGTAKFSVVLKSRPTADVVINLSSNDATEGDVSTGSLVFTPLNWSVAQTVTVTGVDDTIRDGNVSYSVLTSNTQSQDPSYNGKVVSDVSLINQDNDKGKRTSDVSGSTRLKGRSASAPQSSASSTENSTAVAQTNGFFAAMAANWFKRQGADTHDGTGDPYSPGDEHDHNHTTEPWQAVGDRFTLTPLA